MNDFRTNIWSVFQPLYEDKWDQGTYHQRFSGSVLSNIASTTVINQPDGTPP